MKKIINSRIFSFLLGAIIFGGISVVSAYTLFARDTSYTPEDETWEVNNVGAALDDLHNRIETIDDYVHKSYTQEGLGIYENRVNIVSGGYFVDEDNVVWVNLTLKFNRTLNGDDSWLLVYGLPSKDVEFSFTDVDRKHAFKLNSTYVTHPKSNIAFMDFSKTPISVDEEITLQFKY